MNKEKYLRRIGITKTGFPANLENLKFLQKQHLVHIPFENLDIHWKRLILLDVAGFYKKIVGEKRGGFCYELNGLFYELLKELGCDEALNLDGGGSSCLLVNGKPTIKVSDKEGQRPVPAVFLVKTKL